MAKRDHQKGSLPFQFVALPKDVIQSPEWQALPHSSRALAIDLMAQYTGKNNGRLCPAFAVMERCGWSSKTTLINAKRALLESPFVLLTRKGHPPRTAEWIAFTWWRLDYEPSMDVDPKRYPYLGFLNLKPALSVVQKQDRSNPKQAPGGHETGPMKASA